MWAVGCDYMQSRGKDAAASGVWNTLSRAHPSPHRREQGQCKSINVRPLAQGHASTAAGAAPAGGACIQQLSPCTVTQRALMAISSAGC